VAVGSRPTSSVIVSAHDPSSDVNEPLTWEEVSDVLPADVQAQLLLGAIGGSEIVKLTRHDRVQGENVSYQPITNVNVWAAAHAANVLINHVATLKSLRNSYSLKVGEYYVEDALEDYPSSVYTQSDTNTFSVDLSNKDSLYIKTELEKIEDDYISPNSLSSVYGGTEIPSLQNSYLYNVPNIVGVLG
jgi:hypothetical protein